MSAQGEAPAKKPGYYDGYRRVVKDGVPMRVAVWTKDLSRGAQGAIYSDRTFSTPQKGPLK